MSDSPAQGPGVEPLLAIMRQLRDPQNGCPWDRQQTLQTLIPYTLEEAHEVVDAIERNDIQGLRSELGDLLFQIVFYAQLADEQQQFNFQQIVDAICEKMTRRHPHVFADAQFDTLEEQSQSWEQIKQQERQQQKHHSPFADIPKTLPALTQAKKIQARVMQQEVDWPEQENVLSKLEQNLANLKLARENQTPQQIEEQVGELLFNCVSLARQLDCDPEFALRQANRKHVQSMDKMLTIPVSSTDKPSA